MLLWIAIGGAAGSVLRYVIGGAAQRLSGAAFPVGTFLVNVTGCFVIGALTQHYMNTQTHPHVRALLITGLCGGYTTFSAFSLETAGLLQGGEYQKAAAYILVSLTLSVMATFAGIAAVRATT
jgi:fluoride exporter